MASSWRTPSARIHILATADHHPYTWKHDRNIFTKSEAGDMWLAMNAQPQSSKIPDEGPLDKETMYQNVHII